VDFQIGRDKIYRFRKIELGFGWSLFFDFGHSHINRIRDRQGKGGSPCRQFRFTFQQFRKHVAKRYFGRRRLPFQLRELLPIDRSIHFQIAPARPFFDMRLCYPQCYANAPGVPMSREKLAHKREHSSG